MTNATAAVPNFFQCTIESLITLLIKAQLTRGDFTLKQIATNYIKIFSNNIILFAKIKAVLSKAKLKYYTYTPKSEKLKNLVLKGIPGSFTEKEIVDEMNGLQIPQTSIKKVVKINFNKNIPDSYQF